MLPILYQKKNFFKFNNLLSGIIYDNKSYLEGCNNLLEQNNNKNNNNNQNNNNNNNQNNNNKNNKQQYSLKKSYQSIHSQEKPYKINNTSSNQTKLTAKIMRISKNKDRNYNKQIIKSKLLSLTQRLSKHKQFHQNYQINVKNKNKSRQNESISPSVLKNTNCKNSQYKWINIQIRILDHIETQNDLLLLQKKTLTINLQKYFKSMMKKQLIGTITNQFINKIQYYIKKLVQNNLLDQTIHLPINQNYLLSLTSRELFLQSIIELSSKKLENIILNIVRYYCVPVKEFRQSCLRDIILMLSLEIYEKYNYPKNQSYILLNSNGQPITDFMQIYLKSTVLYLTVSQNYQLLYSEYTKMTDLYQLNEKKMNFTELIKYDFRNKVTKGNFDEIGYNYHLNFQAIQNRRKKNVKKAQILISQKTNRKNNKNENEIIYDQKEKKKNSSLKLKLKQQLKKPQILQYQSKRKKQNISEFRQLQKKNQYFDVAFSHHSDNFDKLLIKVLNLHFQYFKDKNEEQKERIIQAFGFLQDKLNNPLSYITLDQYQLMCNVIACKGQKQNIMQFLKNYLHYNIYGQLSRNDLTNVLRIMLNRDENNVEVIEQIIWGWLQKNGLIQNQKLRKILLECWYQKNKMVYYLFISMIFGTNQTTAIDMAYQLLF